MESNNNLKTTGEKSSQGMKIGAILLIIGISIVVVSSKIEQDQVQAVINARMDYINQRYPPGSYRGPEVADYLFSPIPPQPASSGVYLGKCLAGVGVLIIFIKIVQKT